MIISNLKGRLGNALFNIAAGLYLSNKLNTDFAIRYNHGNCRFHYYHDEVVKNEFFKNIKKVYDINESDYYITDDSPNFNITSKETLICKDNQILNGWYINNTYVDDFIKQVYVPSNILSEEIMDLYGPTNNSLSINIRRGDFLLPENIKRGWHSEPVEYWKKGFEYLNTKYDKIFISSDDIEWCKKNIDFCDFIPLDKHSEISNLFLDLFFPTFCKDNMISAGTFSWWGAYLNNHENKQIIMPYPWSTANPQSSTKKFYINGAKLLDINTYIIK